MMNERREASKGNVQLSWTLSETVVEVVCESNEAQHQPKKRADVVSVSWLKDHHSYVRADSSEYCSIVSLNSSHIDNPHGYLYYS